MAKRKILLFANTDWYLYNFRRSLAESLRQEGHEVVLVSPTGPYGPKLEKLGFRWLPFDFSTRSTNPIAELVVLYRLYRLYCRERPDLCHHFTIKCLLYGSIAARLAGIRKVVNAVTGLGHIFTDPGLKARLLRPAVKALYRFALGGEGTRTIFQNSEDRDYFLAAGLVAAERVTLIRGSGVDTGFFTPAPPAPDKEGPIKVLFASRLMREKGIFELLAAARELRTQGAPVQFIFAGDLYPGNPSSLTPGDLDAIRAEGLVDYRGHVDDMRELLAECDIVVLPSYREGTPRILIEAAAMARPIIATDIAGCRGLVVDGENGLLVPVQAVEPLAEAVATLAADAALRLRMGETGRRIVLQDFDEKIVIEKTHEVYGTMGLV